MAIKRMSSREFNQDTGGAKKSAEAGPVYITDRGQPSYVLLTFQDYLRLRDDEPTVIDCLGDPPGVEDVDFQVPVSGEPPRPTRFD